MTTKKAKAVKEYNSTKEQVEKEDHDNEDNCYKENEHREEISIAPRARPRFLLEFRGEEEDGRDDEIEGGEGIAEYGDEEDDQTETGEDDYKDEDREDEQDEEDADREDEQDEEDADREDDEEEQEEEEDQEDQEEEEEDLMLSKRGDIAWTRKRPPPLLFTVPQSASLLAPHRQGPSGAAHAISNDPLSFFLAYFHPELEDIAIQLTNLEVTRRQWAAKTKKKSTATTAMTTTWIP